MYEHKILPFYMTYPLPMYYEEEDTIIRDLEYLQQMYPAEAKRYQILDRIRREEEKENSEQNSSAEKWEWMGDMVQILLCYEIYKRRHNTRRGILRF